MASVVAEKRPPNFPSSKTAPPLEQGAFLSASEFLRRYENMPDLKKAELIDGIVYMGSPVSLLHGRPDQLAQLWVGTYVLRTPPIDSASNVTVCFDGQNISQPDLLVRIPEEFGGISIVTPEHYVQGPPDLIIEIAATSASVDSNQKFSLYQRCGVPEYVVWKTLEPGIKWFLLDQDEYRENLPDGQGIIRSRRFPGLALDTEAALSLDRERLIATLEKEMASEAHGAFVLSFQKKS